MTNQTIINWDTGTIKENEPVFIEFNNYLKELGFNIVFTQFSNSNYLSIYVHSIEDVENAKKIISKKSSEVVDKLFSIVNKHGQVLKCDRSVIAQPFYQLDKDNKPFKIKPEFDIIFDTKVKEKESD